MDNYLQKYDSLNKKIVYTFCLGEGGIGDMLKFFMILLNYCIKNDIKIHYLKNNTVVEKYLRLVYPNMYIKKCDLHNTRSITDIHMIQHIDSLHTYTVSPHIFYSIGSDYDQLTIPISRVFKFSDEILTRKYMYNPYVSIHLRLGDKFLETDEAYISIKNDARSYNDNAIDKCIESQSIPVMFFCDNLSYKTKVKERYPYINITGYSIGHTSLSNTSELQIIDAVTEFFFLSQSAHIYAASHSGFSLLASKFYGVPFSYI